MTGFKTYFKSHFKSKISVFILILAVVATVTLIISIRSQPYQQTDYDEVKKEFVYSQDYRSTVWAPVTVLSFLAYILPVAEFSFFKKRRNLDCAYAMPISRRAMGMVHYLIGLITLSSAFTLSYICNLIVMLTRGSGYFDYAPMIWHYFLSLVLGAVIYSFLTFVFNEGNTVGDGMWFMFLYSLVFFFITFSFMVIVDASNVTDGNEVFCAVPIAVIYTLTGHAEYLIELDYSEYHTNSWTSPGFIVWLVLWIILGVASVIGIYYTFGKRRTEKTGEISDSYFGYRVLIPVCGFSLIVAFMDMLVMGIIVFVIAIIGYTIFRRGIHYKKSDILMLGLMLLLAIVLS